MSIYARRNHTNWLVVHCSATKSSLDIGAKEIRSWHKHKGWIDIGYHFVIRRNGKVEHGRPDWAVGAHVKNYNSTSLGICMVGGVNKRNEPENNFTDAQFAALAELLRDLKDKYPDTDIQGHRDFPHVHKACPCFDVRHWIKTTGVFETSYVDDELDTPTIEVKNGDTFYSIAKHYGTDVETLMKINPQIDPYHLHVGSILRLPEDD